MTNFIKKLSSKTVLDKKVTARLLGDKQQVALYHVIGNAVGTKNGDSDYGQWTALTGQFEATNLETGEVYASSMCFLPDVALLPVLAALSEGTAVQFAIEIGIKGDETSAVGYTYTMRPLIEVRDSLADLRGKMKALSAPAKTEEKETAKKGKAA